MGQGFPILLPSYEMGTSENKAGMMSTQGLLCICEGCHEAAPTKLPTGIIIINSSRTHEADRQ